MSTQIRKALASDVDRLIDLSHRTINASYRSFLGDRAVDSFIESGAADRYVQENISSLLVILIDEAILGYAGSRGNLIDLMMIDHASHRRGFGTLLLHAVEAALFQKHHELRLESFEGNGAANAFYRKNGWLEVSRYFDQESRTNKIIFEKSAQPSGVKTTCRD